MAFTTKSSELEMVNAVLRLMGESPVASVDEGPQVVEAALGAINETDRRVQADGWWFNTDYARKVEPVADEIVLGSAALKVTPRSLTDQQNRSYLRGDKLYDPVRQSFTYTSAVELDVVELVPLDETPQTYRDFVVAEAALEIQKAQFGTETLVATLAQRRADTWAALRSESLDYQRRSMLNTENSFRTYRWGKNRRYLY